MMIAKKNKDGTVTVTFAAGDLGRVKGYVMRGRESLEKAIENYSLESKKAYEKDMEIAREFENLVVR